MVTRRSLIGGVIATPLTLLLGIPAGIAAASPDGARDFVEGLIGQAIDVLRIPLEKRPLREAGFRALLEQHFDLPLITRLVVGRHWRKATDVQKQAFAVVFEEHIVRVYTSQLGVYQDETVTVRNVAPRTENDTVVGTEVVRRSDPPLRVDWLVHERDGSYRIIDVAAEGVSMLTTKRSEFSSVIAREGLDGLISRLKQLNASDVTEVGES
jgi:phospholipid transport system substrate-binding protein